MSTEDMSARELLAHFSARLEDEATEVKKNGGLVCWSASVAPPELCVAMDIAMVYPENHSAAIGARKGSLPLLEIADQKGYNRDTCSYGRVNMGYMELLKRQAMTGERPEALQDFPAATPPLPDLVITCNNICNTLLKWYENLAAELNIPCIIIDVPFNHTMPVPEYAKEYLAAQFEYAKKRLEKICGRPFDEEKFLEAQKQTQRSVEQWDRVASMLAHKPSPLNGFDLFNFMALIVTARSRDYAEITFRKFADELEENLKNGKYAFGDNEKSRVTWEGIAVWTYLGHTFKSLRNMGSLMTGSAYPGMWSLRYTPGDLKSMGEAYTRVYINCCLEYRAEVLTEVVRSGKCDGLLAHMNRSCKLMSLLNYDTAELVRKKLKVPYVAFDGDQTDPRNFAPAQFDTRVQSLVEMMDR
ncbi:MAG: 2-hydroxyacyl-CoA dehydratase family protein [Desulfovibrio sp.]|nr:2-hydroxyacyl-CoA dehydratase family protein [Desulfovibrio sp.]